MRQTRQTSWWWQGVRGGIGFLSAAAFVILTAGRAVGQAAPAAGVQVYGCDIHDVAEADTATAAAIHLVGARNGGYSGKVVVRSKEPIQGLQARVSDLRQGSDAIPAAAIQVRYGALWDSSRSNPPGCDILLEAPLPEFPAGRVPVWVTVRVPKTAKPGVYAGQLTVQTKSLAATVVPVKLDVRNHTLPDTQQYRTWIETVKSPDTLAVEYDVPLWSEPHWAMVGKSMQLVSDLGDRMVHVPLIARTNFGNAESMVRWIKKGENSYDYDFTVLDKFLDTVEKNQGTPKIVMVDAWEQYLAKATGVPKPLDPKWAEGSYDWREAMSHNARIQGKGPAVTSWDPATKKTDTIELPRYEDPKAKELWKPVWEGVRQRLVKRGWDKAMMVGNLVDIWPAKEEAKVLSELSGGAPWTCCAHHYPVKGPALGKLHGVHEVGYGAIALDEYYTLNPTKGERTYGWKFPALYVHYFRFQVFNTATYPELHNLAERVISGNKRGIGHIGADFWMCLKTKSGQRRGTVTDRFPESYWHSLNIMGYLLAPGPQGPVGTARLEIFREGIEECEARIAIEQALTDETQKTKLGADLAQRAQEYLDQRQMAIWKAAGASDADIAQYGIIKEYRTFLFEVAKRMDAKAGTKWYLTSGWQERNGKLYDLAGEVSKKLGS